MQLISREKISLTGQVQGVGFRPFVYNLALKLGINGFVLNNGEGVVIEAEAKKELLEAFREALLKNHPPLAKIDTISVEELPSCLTQGFCIKDSKNSQIFSLIPPDIATCKKCHDELCEPKNRRFGYPFINCTECGPRYTIIKNLPYDRVNTSMEPFEMCGACYAEYSDPHDRRYHAQPIGCYSCGAKLFVRSKNKSSIEQGREIEHIAHAIEQGMIVAIKGLGGFHILCDAENDSVVKRLRELKNRPRKPFGVMVQDIAMAQEFAEITPKEEELLCSKEAPIVVLKKRKACELIAPKIEHIGLFLAYTPVHILLFEKLKRPLVATSANLGGEPIITDGAVLLKKLPFVDFVLDNDRAIINGCDDSVVGVADGKELFFRVARGYAPLSFYQPDKTAKKILAVGANQKNTLSLAFGNYILTSPHIGDLGTLEAFEFFTQTYETFKRVYNFVPDVVVCDKHPNYETTKWAKSLENVEIIELQHHYAHTLALMCEHNLDEEVLSFSFDGTGLGDDGELWGGEVFLADTKSYRRLLHFEKIKLLGGEAAIKEPKRLLLAKLFEIYPLNEVLKIAEVREYFGEAKIKLYYQLYQKNLNALPSSSVGRLFDVVYAIIDERAAVSYEGEGAVCLEAMAHRHPSEEYFPFCIKDGVIETASMIESMLGMKNKAKIASMFINTLVEIIDSVAQQYEKKILFSGGVFQNRVLVEKVSQRLKHKACFFAHKTSPNDSAISLGQAYYARSLLKTDKGR